MMLYKKGDKVLARRKLGLLNAQLSPFVGKVMVVHQDQLEVQALDCECGQSVNNISFLDLLMERFDPVFRGHMHIIYLEDVCPVPQNASAEQIKALKVLFK